MSLIKDAKVAVITGTTSNLGINIAYRLLEQLPPHENITLIVTSRTLPKVKEVITTIKQYADTKLPERRTGDLEFDYLLVDFTNMISVLTAYYDLNKKYNHIDYFFVNAAQGVYSGLDWIGATKQILTNPLDGVTNPTYKIQEVGKKSKDGLGLVFQANVFGPYYLIHKIKHLLSGGGRVIWISSIMSAPKYLSFNDLQLIKSPESYEGSKRLIDLMHIGTYKSLKSNHDIVQYLVHPGIFTSFSFFQYLNVFTYYGMLFLFYVARWLGSPYHNISGYIAANAPVKAALSGDKKKKKDKYSGLDQDVKIGSISDKRGKESLEFKEIDGTGNEDVVAYLEDLCQAWDEKLKNQIVNTRQP
ncbi:3-keto-steroid reductase [Scheffersomyces coipomensis]|uniref:3-keto-steroid reductase n=1 Tax=Scheffersomyces coipomensis TaxID=1788519 RepID=UPI00315DF0AC